MERTAKLFVFALMLALVAVMAFGTAAFAEPTPGAQVHLPILNYLGPDNVCDVVIEVQNVGNTFTKAMLLFWGPQGPCPPQAIGPIKVECSGLLKPGSTWNFIGGAGSALQVPADAVKAVVFSLSAAQVEDIFGVRDIIADAVCEFALSDIRLDADDYRRFKKSFDEDGGESFFGVEVAGEPLAVEVVRKCDPATGTAPIVSAYSGIAGQMLGAPDPVFGGGQVGFMYYAPLLYAGFEPNLNSYIYIQNAGLECSSVEIWLKRQGECIQYQIDEIIALAPGETTIYDVNRIVPPPWTGNAWIRSSVPLAIVVDNWSDQVLMTYHGKPAELNFTFNPNAAFFTQGSQVNYGPLIYREHQGWNTKIQVQNLSSVVNAKVKVYFIDNSGDIIKTVVDWICPRGSATFASLVIDGLPGQWVGQVRVESQEWWSPGDPKVLPPNVVSVAELIRWEGPAQNTLLEGVAYNLFPESQAFNWQIGSGHGGIESGVGLIGIPSFLKNQSGGGQTGLNTELAITNLVPKPGFTDFAIYIYDQNGLLDYVCEKLNEKQVEYINVDDWGYIMPGFKGSAVISATFWEHPVFSGGGEFERNLVGLAAVKVERFAVPQAIDPTFDEPGDHSSASEGFPIFGPWNYGEFEGFDFEGPQVPACPGVGENVCLVPLTIGVHDGAGAPLVGAGYLVQLQKNGNPVHTGVTDSTGTVHFTVEENTTFDVVVIRPGQSFPTPILPGTDTVGPLTCGTKDNVANVELGEDVPIKDCIALDLDGVVDECGNGPVPGAVVGIFNFDSADDTTVTTGELIGDPIVTADAPTDANGEFEFDANTDCDSDNGLREGVYAIAVDLDGDGVFDQVWQAPNSPDGSGPTQRIELIDTDADGDIDAADLFFKHNANQINFVGSECATCNPVTIAEVEVTGSTSTIVTISQGGSSTTYNDGASVQVGDPFASNASIEVDVTAVVGGETKTLTDIVVDIPCEPDAGQSIDLVVDTTAGTVTSKPAD